MRLRALWTLTAAALVVGGPAEAKKKKKDTSQTTDTSAPTTTAAPTPAAPEAAAEPPAPTGPKLVVVPIPASGAERWGELARSVAAGSIQSAGKQVPFDLADALDPTAASARAKAGKEGRAQLRAAHGAYDQLDMEVSSVLCDKAYANFLKSDLTKNFSKLIEAWGAQRSRSSLRILRRPTSSRTSLGRCSRSTLATRCLRTSSTPTWFIRPTASVRPSRAQPP